MLIFLALENEENVDPEEGGGCDEDNPQGGRHQEEVDVLNRHPKGAARLKQFHQIPVSTMDISEYLNRDPESDQSGLVNHILNHIVT